jgi:uncharacterized protein (DUF433 family)
MKSVAYPHIEIDADGVPCVAGTRTKVVEIVLAHLSYSWDAEEIHRQHPDLSLAVIHSALAFYYDNQAEIDKDIERRMRDEARILAEIERSPIQLRLRAAKRAAMGIEGR